MKANTILDTTGNTPHIRVQKLFPGDPFCKLSGPANLLIMPAIHSASISTKMLQELGGGTLVGPYLVGFKESIQIAPLGANVADIVNLAALSAFKS